MVVSTSNYYNDKTREPVLIISGKGFTLYEKSFEMCTDLLLTV